MKELFKLNLDYVLDTFYSKKISQPFNYKVVQGSQEDSRMTR